MKTENSTLKTDLPVEINDAAWQSILPFLREFPKVYVGNPETCRTFLSALVWMTKPGAPWRGLPKVYGYWNSIYRRFGRWYGGFTTKLQVSAVSDTFLPLRFILTAGASHDVRQVPALIARYTFECVIADTAYDSDPLRAEILAQEGVAVIRPRNNRVQQRPYDQGLYKLRNVIERFFHRLKQYSRVATRYDKYANRYLEFIYFAAILITAKKM